MKFIKLIHPGIKHRCITTFYFTILVTVHIYFEIIKIVSYCVYFWLLSYIFISIRQEFGF